MKPTESGIVASSAKYSYRFVRDGVPQEYQRYKTFYERFHQQASGVRVNFVVVQHEVTAEYLVVMDQRKLDAGQHSELVNQYHDGAKLITIASGCCLKRQDFGLHRTRQIWPPPTS